MAPLILNLKNKLCQMTSLKPLRVAALVDLPRSPLSGGHVKGWESLARAAITANLPLDLTVFFSGAAPLSESWAKRVRIRHLPPVFSTARLRFLPYVPDHTDLAPYHSQLAKELRAFDVIHTTDGFFAFARTAERVARRYKIPLVTSFHTDTPAYARVFTHAMIESWFGHGRLARFLLQTLRLPERQEAKKIARLKKHLSACAGVFVTREGDRALVRSVIAEEKIHTLRNRVDMALFGPHKKDRRGVEEAYRIPEGRVLILFVGRLDVGKNIYTLIEAMENLISEGRDVHLITAGLGPAEADLHGRLGDRVTVAGYVEPEDLAVLYASVDLFAMPSEVEIGSRAATEALASGVPLLVSEKCGVAPVFDHTPAIRVVPSGADAWTEALRDLAGSLNQRTHMAKVALACAQTHIASWQDILTDLYAVWQQAAQNSRRL